MPTAVSARTALLARTTAVVTAGVLSAAVLLPSALAAPTSASHSSARRDASVSVSAASLTARVGADERVEVIAARTAADGSLTIVRRSATGRAAATDTVTGLQADPAVLAVSLDDPVHLVDPVTSLARGSDEFRDRQWGLTRLRAERVWPLATGAGQTVAVIDSGVDGNHPDLAGQVLPGKDYVGGATGAKAGWNDQNGHGTHVGGIVAALRDNTIGVVGLAPDAKILPVRVLDKDGEGDEADLADAITWASKNGATVINLSLGGPQRDPVVSAAVADAVAKGITVVAAAGNYRAEGNPVSYPAADPGVIAVAATGTDDLSAAFSNYGPYVDLAAPGVQIGSTYVDGGTYTYAAGSGTSMAAPFVSAAAALVRQKLGSTGDQVASRLFSSADDLEYLGKDVTTGYGLVDPYAALVGPAPATVTLTTPRKATAGKKTKVSVSMRAAGAPVAAARVAIVYSHYRRVVTTDAKGNASFTMAFSTRTAVRAGSASGDYRTPVVTRTVEVVPLVKTKRTAKKLVVKVRPAAHQKVTVWTKAGKKWRVADRAKLKSSGKAVFPPIPRGAYRVKVSSTAHLLGWKSKTLR